MDRKRFEEFARSYFRPWFVRVLFGVAAVITGALFIEDVRSAIPKQAWPWLVAALFALVSVALCENKLHALQVARARYGAKVRGLRKQIAELEAALTHERARYRECRESHTLLRQSIDGLSARAGLGYKHPPSPQGPAPSLDPGPK